ncbi:hypothetical protein D3C83_109930 [compost metagenome]
MSFQVDIDLLEFGQLAEYVFCFRVADLLGLRQRRESNDGDDEGENRSHINY